MQLRHWIVDFLHKKGLKIEHPHGTPRYVLLLFHDPLTVWYEGRAVSVGANTAVFYKPGMPQLYYNNKQDYSHDGVFFVGDDVEPLLQRLNIEPGRPYQLDNPDAISSVIRDVAAESISGGSHSDEIIDLQLRILLTRLSDAALPIEQQPSIRYHEFVRLRRDIYANPSHDWTVEQLSERAHVSTSRFQHLYRQYFGTTPVKDIIRCRIERAQYMLRSSSKQVYEIAEDCGYNNVEHFCRQFKAYTGITPGDYRAGEEGVRILSGGTGLSADYCK